MKFKDFVEEFESTYNDWINTVGGPGKKAYWSFDYDEPKPAYSDLIWYWKQLEIQRSMNNLARVMILTTIILSGMNLAFLLYVNGLLT